MKEKKRCCRGYWNKENVIAEIKRIMIKHNLQRVPSYCQLDVLGYSYFGYHINKVGGYRTLREEFGEIQIIKEVGVWKSLDYTIQQAQKIKIKHKLENLPSFKQLDVLGHSSLARAIHKYHGGFHRFRQILGEKMRRKPNGFWQNKDNVIREAQEFMRTYKLETFSLKTLQELNYTTLMSAIVHHFGGLVKFREELDLKSGKEKVSKKQWKDLEFTLKYARNLMEEEGWEQLPPERVLRETGNCNLSTTITRYHGGIVRFRELLFERLNIVQSPHLKGVSIGLLEALLEETQTEGGAR